MTTPSGGEVWPAAQTFPIDWRSFDPGGSSGYTLSFNGSTSYVDMGNPSSGVLDLGPDATLEAWVCFDALPSRSIAAIASKDAGAGAANKWIFGYADNYDGVSNATVFLIDNGATGYSVVSSSAWTPALHQWYQVALVKAGGSYSFYLDGVLQDTVSATVDVPAVAASFQVGCAEGSFYWQGQIGDLQLWNVSRSTSDIQATMDTLLAGNDAGLAGYWPFDEGSGSTTADLTSNGDTGTLGGGTAADQPAWLASTVLASTVDIDLMQNGVLVSNIATGVFNTGQYWWSIPAGTSPGSYSICVSIPADGLPPDTSAALTIVPPVHVYYVNDGTVLPGDWTTAPGSDANDGLTPATPKASIQAVLAAYNLGPGDVIQVDDGTYDLDSDILLGVADSGITIEGYHDAAYPDRAAVLDRGNTNNGEYVFQLAGATGVTLEDLAITGGYDGIYADSTAASTYLTVSHCEVYGNANDDIFLDTSNDYTLLTGNAVHDAPTGISVAGIGDTVSGNAVYATSTGITSNFSTSGVAGVTISDNTVYDNSSVGISTAYNPAGNDNVLVVGNTVYGQQGNGAIGIEVAYGGVAQQNVAYDNYYGISIVWSGQALDNRVYNNSQAGIYGTWGDGTDVIQGNTVYSNGVGVQIQGSYPWQLTNNLIYANVNQGILLDDVLSSQITNNTIYQPVGDAIRIQDSSQNISLLNNILWVQAGYDLYVTPDSQTGFQSNYNLFFLGTVPDSKAHLGFWNNATVDLNPNPGTPLSDWQSSSGQDGNSVYGDPKFVDPAGADHVLGYDPVHDYDGGQDDNFSLSAGSPAIDRGESWGVPPTDITGASRYNDPGTPNAGSPDYAVTPQTTSLFSTSGMAQGWQGSDTYYTFDLPFAFNFYGTAYTTVQVSTSGFLQFAGNDSAGDNAPTAAKLLSDARIAPLWMDLNTNDPGNDIFVNTSVSGEVMIRWQATNAVDGSQVDFAVVLFSDGSFRFDYGSGNTNVGSAIIGISAGNGDNWQIASYTGQSSLTGAASLLYTLQPGFVDIGAYEFLGNSLDTTPPAITGSTPSVVASSGTTATPFQQLQLTLSEPLNPIDADAPAAFQLLGHQGSGAFGGPGDSVYTLVPQYTPGSTTVTISIVVPGGGELPAGNYQFTVFGSVVHDLSGLSLAGDGTTASTNYVRTFSVFGPTNIQLSVTRVAESQPAGTVVGTLSTVDADPIADSFTYALVPGIGSTDNASFSIVGNQLETAGPLDYNVQSSFAIRVQTTDSEGMLFPKAFLITVVPPETQTWSGSGDDNSWSTGTNWSTLSGPNPGDDLVFQGTTQTATSNNLPAGTSLHSITLASPGFVLRGNGVTLASASAPVVTLAARSGEIDLPITFGSDATFAITDAQGSLTDSGDIDNGGHNLTFDTSSSQASTLSGSISASSTEFVGEFWLRKLAKCVV